MSNHWQSRITGETRSTPPEGDPLGIWVDSSNAPWVGDGDEAVGMDEKLLPSSSLTEGIKRVSEYLNELGIKEWMDWCQRVPVDDRVTAPPKLNREEEILEKSISRFEEIARLPRAHLKVEEMRVPVGRARRFPPRALNVLASHSEDWHSRSFGSVRPNRVLSEVSDDDYGIYENRALKTLQKRLLIALTPRLTWLRTLRKALKAFDPDLTKSSRYINDRLCNLLFEIFKDIPDTDILDKLIERLESLRMRLLALEGMFLFKEIKSTTKVSSPLQSTNILRDDSQYRHVFRVWMARETHKKEKTTKRDRLLKDVHGFDRFTGLLCVRAINLLRMDSDSVDNPPFHPGGASILLKHHWSLSWNPNGTLTFEHQDGTSSLHVIGAPAQLSRLPASTVERIISQVEAETAKGVSVLFITLRQKEGFPESWPKNLQQKLNTWREKPQEVPSVFLAEVSAGELDSIELIARVFRRIIAEHDWPILPISIPLDNKFQTLFPELSKDITNQWSKPPRKSLISRLIKIKDSLVPELEALNLDNEQAIRDRRSHSPDPAKRKASRILCAQLDDAILILKEKSDFLTTTLEQVQDVERKFLPALACPCCGHNTTNSPVGSAFTCSSNSCKTEWGRQHDHSVFLRPDGDDPTTTKEDPIQMYGADYI
jgi:hypothetical protein